MATQVRVTNGQRVVDPSTGFTKLELVRFYAALAPWLLPHLRGRHTYVVRFLQGIIGPRVFQQHPEGLRGFRGTDPALWPGHEPAIAIETVEDVVKAAQFDTLEFHTWNSTAAAITLPDRLIFDLDPGEQVPWAQVRQAAQLVRVMLQELGLESWVKTTGGKGLHVVAPVTPEFPFPHAKGFSRSVVLHLEKTLPQLFVSKSGASNRVGRIFIDYLRNGQSQSTASAFSVRARPRLGVSMPIGWDELARVDAADHWHVGNALAYLQARKRDPWAGYWKRRQSMAAGIEALGSKPLR